MSEPVIRARGLEHAFGEGELRRRVLTEIDTEVDAGEIVIVTGPSGSGKTTLLTLIGALRSVQSGSLQVLGRELRGASEATLADVRRRIGYVFQAHNLLEALSARQNVMLALALEPGIEAHELRKRAGEALAAVGLGDRCEDHPSQLSGGERQRVAIARALVRRPELVLADEPTASLDRETGRGIVELIERLARSDGVTVLLVTHDARILDIADRILALEDGRLSSLMQAVARQSGPLLRRIGPEIRRGDLARRVRELDADQFAALLDQVTEETRRLLALVEMVQSETFESVLSQVVHAFLEKVCELFHGERASLIFLHADGGQAWSSEASSDAPPRDLGGPLEHGIAADVIRRGELVATDDAGSDPRFDPSVDTPGARPVRGLVAVPMADSRGAVFGVVEIVNHLEGGPFEPDEVERLRAYARTLAFVLESWWRMSCTCRSARVGGSCPACGTSFPAVPALAGAIVGPAPQATG